MNEGLSPTSWFNPCSVNLSKMVRITTNWPGAEPLVCFLWARSSYAKRLRFDPKIGCLLTNTSRAGASILGPDGAEEKPAILAAALSTASRRWGATRSLCETSARNAASTFSRVASKNRSAVALRNALCARRYGWPCLGSVGNEANASRTRTNSSWLSQILNLGFVNPKSFPGSLKPAVSATFFHTFFLQKAIGSQSRSGQNSSDLARQLRTWHKDRPG